MQSSHTFSIESAVFDERNLVSAGGLVPVLELAEQTGLSRLIGEHVDLPSTRVASGAVNPTGKLTTIIAGMMCGADSIDDANLLRAGGTPRVFDEVYAPSTVGILLREFTFGHPYQLAAVARAHLIALAAPTPAPRNQQRVPENRPRRPPSTGHRNQAPPSGPTTRRPPAAQGGPSPITTPPTPPAAPPIADAAWRRGNKAASGRAAPQHNQPATTAPRTNPQATTIVARDASAFTNKKIVAARLDEQVVSPLPIRHRRRINTTNAPTTPPRSPRTTPRPRKNPRPRRSLPGPGVPDHPYTLPPRAPPRHPPPVVPRHQRPPLPGPFPPVCHHPPFITTDHLTTHPDHTPHRKPTVENTTPYPTTRRAPISCPVCSPRTALRVAGLRSHTTRLRRPAATRAQAAGPPRATRPCDPAKAPSPPASPPPTPTDPQPPPPLPRPNRGKNPVGQNIRYKSANPPGRIKPPPPPTRHPRPDPGDTWKAGAGQRITHAHTIPNRPNRAEISPPTQQKQLPRDKG